MIVLFIIIAANEMDKTTTLYFDICLNILRKIDEILKKTTSQKSAKILSD